MKKVVTAVLLILLVYVSATWAEEAAWRRQPQRLVGIDYTITVPDGYYLLNANTASYIQNDRQIYQNLKRAQGKKYLEKVVADNKNVVLNEDGRICITFSVTDYGNDIGKLYLKMKNVHDTIYDELKAYGCSSVDCDNYRYGDNEVICAFGEGEFLDNDDINGYFLMVDYAGRWLEFWTYNMDRETTERILCDFKEVEHLPNEINRSIPAYDTFDDTPSLCRTEIWANRLEVMRNELAVSISGQYTGFKLPDAGVLELPDVILDLPVIQIGRDAFRGSESIVRVMVPASVQMIRSGAFDNMEVLTEVVLQEGTLMIEDNFNHCPKLANVVVPASVKFISERSFNMDNPYFRMTVEKGSYAEEYAKKRELPYKYSKNNGSISVVRGNTVAFGSQNGRKIEWWVLETEEQEALLLAKDVLDVRAFSEGDSFRWEDSDIKAYLNDELFLKLFSMDEAEIITAHRIYDPGSPYSLSGLPGKAGFCHLFLLSYFEARDLLPDDTYRAASENWWLRTTDVSENAHTVDASGFMRGGSSYAEQHGIRPALWVRMDNAGGVIGVTDDSEWLEQPEMDDGVFGRGDVIQLGHYEQDNDTSNGREPIDWIVLENDEKSAVLITKYCIDVKEYHSGGNAVNWSESSLREWLNSTFLNTAFDEEEKKALIRTSVENFNTDAARSSYMYSYMIPPIVSNDMVWIIDDDEAALYFPKREDKLAYATRYAAAKGAATNNEGYATWLLRTDKNDQKRANIMFPYRGCLSVENRRGDASIRPAIRVDLVRLGIAEAETETAMPIEETSAPIASLGFISPEDGITVKVGKKLALEWTQIPNARCYVVNAYPADKTDYYIVWQEIFYNGECSAEIPRSTLIDPCYKIVLRAWAEDHPVGGREIFTTSITVNTYDKFADSAG